jgi:hypothetical protein
MRLAWLNMKIIPAVVAFLALFALVGCTAPRSNAGMGGSPDHYSQVSGFAASGSRTLAYPQGDYRDILSAPGPF